MIKLYVCEISDLIEEVKKNENFINNYCDKLGKMRIEHILKNYKAEDRARSLGAALLLLFALQEVGLQPERLPDFSYLKNGKPYLKEFKEVHFNLSHTGNIITCVISDAEVGVDVEHIRKIKDVTIDRVFTDKEKKIAGYQMEGYIRLWTIKEACAKLRGNGLSDILDGLEVCEEGNEKKVKKLNQDIRKTSCYTVVAEGKLLDSYKCSYYYSVCSKKSTGVELVYTRWDTNKFFFSSL